MVDLLAHRILGDKLRQERLSEMRWGYLPKAVEEHYQKANVDQLYQRQAAAMQAAQERSMVAPYDPSMVSPVPTVTRTVPTPEPKPPEAPPVVPAGPAGSERFKGLDWD